MLTNILKGDIDFPAAIDGTTKVGKMYNDL
jgi:hypothetical protein